MKKLFKRFKRSEKGQGMVEYGLILALVSVVAIGTLGGIGDSVKGTLDKVTNGVGIEEEVVDDNTPVAKDTDFEWVSQSRGYEATNQTSKGYYKYVGDEKEVKIPHEINGHDMTSYYRMFYKSPVEKVVSDNPNVTNMYGMFDGSSATSLDLSSFNTSKATNMSYMFCHSKATSLDLSSFDTSKVTDMSAMFMSSEMTDLNLSSFDTGNVTDMSAMFRSSKATTLDLSGFDTGNVTNMGQMFWYSKATIIHGIDSFITSNVTHMDNMFRQSEVMVLNLSSFDTSSVTDMSHMFNYSKTTILDLSSFDTSSVTDMSHMFSNSSTTTGYARTQTDVNKFNSSVNKPSGLTFTVKN